MKLSVAERLLAAIAAVATLVAFADAYLFSSRIVAAFRLPPNLPTSVSILMFLCPTAVALLLASRLARGADLVATLRSELENLQRQYKSSTLAQEELQEQLNSLQDQAAMVDKDAVQKESLRKQIVALLATRYLDEEALRAHLGISARDSDQKTLLREVIADLLSEGIVGTRGGGDYALRRLKGSGAG